MFGLGGSDGTVCAQIRVCVMGHVEDDDPTGISRCSRHGVLRTLCS